MAASYFFAWVSGESPCRGPIAKNLTLRVTDIDATVRPLAGAVDQLTRGVNGVPLVAHSGNSRENVASNFMSSTISEGTSSTCIASIIAVGVTLT